MKTTLPSKGASATTATKRPASARGSTELGWLQSRHSFSFGNYFDPDQMGFRSLRVINDDVVEAGGGFGMHHHRDAEIFSYVIEGELEHRDSMGNGRIVRAGDLQYMSAGRGVQHSEVNPSPDRPVHFLQVWLQPKESGGEPRYAEKTMGRSAKANALTLLFAPEARDGAIAIRQDAEIYFGRIEPGKNVNVPVTPDRGVWIQMIRGEVQAARETLVEGDGLAIANTEEVNVTGRADAEFLLFVLT